MNWKIVGILIVLIAIAAGTIISQLGIKPSVKSESLEINLPQGFGIEVFADNLGGSPVSYPGTNPGPRMMLFLDNVLFVTIPSQGRVVALPFKEGDNKTNETITFIDGLNNPHGIDHYDGWFYIAEENRVIRVKPIENSPVADRNTLAVLVNNLPTGGHFTRTIKVHNNSLYISIGSS